MPAPECTQLAGAGRAEARGGAAGRTARRWPAPGASGRTRRAAESARVAARPPPETPVWPRRRGRGRGPGRRSRTLSRPAAGSRAPGPAALGRLRPPSLTSAPAPSRPSRRRGGGRPPTRDLRCPGPPQHGQGPLAWAARGRPDHLPAAAAAAAAEAGSEDRPRAQTLGRGRGRHGGRWGLERRGAARRQAPAAGMGRRSGGGGGGGGGGGPDKMLQVPCSSLRKKTRSALRLP